MPRVKVHKARTDIYNRGLQIPDTKTKSGFRVDRSQPADENDTLFCKAGMHYYSWGMIVNGRGVAHRSLTHPRRSQLTNSEFLGRMYDLEDELKFSECRTIDELVAMRDDVVRDLREFGEEQQAKYDNMPDALQGAETGQLLEARAQACSDIADALDEVDLDDYEEPDDEELREAVFEDYYPNGRDSEDFDEEDFNEQVENLRSDKYDEWLEEKSGELESVSWDYE